MGHAALRVYAQPGGSSCYDPDSGWCPHSKVVDEGAGDLPICVLFPSTEEPFTRLEYSEVHQRPRRAKACQRAEIASKERDMVTRSEAYASVQHTLSREEHLRGAPRGYHEAIKYNLRRAIDASDGMVSAANSLEISRHQLRRLVKKYGLHDAVERARRRGSLPPRDPTIEVFRGKNIPGQ